jgi:hypothetical protein
VLLARAPAAEEADRLRRLFLTLEERHFAGFPGTIFWPDEACPDLRQQLPDGVVPLAEVLAPADGAADSSWKLPLLAGFAAALDELAGLGFRLNSISLGSVLVGRECRAFAGLCLLPCLTGPGDGGRDSLAGINGAFAAPEVQGFVEAPVGPAADVYLLGALSYYLLSARKPRDLMACGFALVGPDDGLGPAVREVLEDTLSTRPEARPESGAAFLARLRQALLGDAGRDGFAVRHSAWSDIGLGGRANNEDSCLAWAAAVARGGAPSRLAAFAVSDGIGGSALGERASAFCVERLAEEMARGTHLAGAALDGAGAGLAACRAWVEEVNRGRSPSAAAWAPARTWGPP